MLCVLRVSVAKKSYENSHRQNRPPPQTNSRTTQPTPRKRRTWNLARHLAQPIARSPRNHHRTIRRPAHPPAKPFRMAQRRLPRLDAPPTPARTNPLDRRTSPGSSAWTPPATASPSPKTSPPSCPPNSPSTSIPWEKSKTPNNASNNSVCSPANSPASAATTNAPSATNSATSNTVPASHPANKNPEFQKANRRALPL